MGAGMKFSTRWRQERFEKRLAEAEGEVHNFGLRFERCTAFHYQIFGLNDQILRADIWTTGKYRTPGKGTRFFDHPVDVVKRLAQESRHGTQQQQSRHE